MGDVGASSLTPSGPAPPASLPLLAHTVGEYDPADLSKGADELTEQVEPTAEPEREPFDPHTGPLDDDDDARFLDPADPRRRDVEARRGRPFGED